MALIIFMVDESMEIGNCLKEGEKVRTKFLVFNILTTNDTFCSITVQL